MYGPAAATTRTYDAPRAPARKRTSFMSNSKAMLHRLSRRCDGQHDHQHLEGGRAAAAENYPDNLVRAIVQGMADTRDNVHALNNMNEDEWNAIRSLTEQTTPNDEP